jgi:hypothetical protein
MLSKGGMVKIVFLILNLVEKKMEGLPEGLEILLGIDLLAG